MLIFNLQLVYKSKILHSVIMRIYFDMNSALSAKLKQKGIWDTTYEKYHFYAFYKKILYNSVLIVAVKS